MLRFRLNCAGELCIPVFLPFPPSPLLVIPLHYCFLCLVMLKQLHSQICVIYLSFYVCVPCRLFVYVLYNPNTICHVSRFFFFHERNTSQYFIQKTTTTPTTTTTRYAMCACCGPASTRPASIGARVDRRTTQLCHPQ